MMAVSIQCPGAMCPAHPPHCHRQGCHDGAGGKPSSLPWVLDAAEQTERGYLLPAGSGHPQPRTTSAHCIAVRPATVRLLGSHRGGDRGGSGSSIGICSLQQYPHNVSLHLQPHTPLRADVAGAQACASASTLMRAGYLFIGQKKEGRGKKEGISIAFILLVNGCFFTWPKWKAEVVCHGVALQTRGRVSSKTWS